MDLLKKISEIEEELNKINNAFNAKEAECEALRNENNRLKSQIQEKTDEMVDFALEKRDELGHLINEIGKLKRGQHKTEIVMNENQNDTAIVIITYNNANLIKRQVELIRKFHKETVDVIIVDNSTDEDTIKAIKYYNDTELKCLYLKTDATSKNGSESHSFSANIAYLTYKNEYKYFLFLDFDCFPTRPFSIKEMLAGKMAIGMGQNKDGIEYFWPGCYAFNNGDIDQSLVDFSCSHELKLDTGGFSFRIIEKYGKEACPFLNEIHVQNPNFTKSFYNFYSEIGDGLFMHFINSSNWAGAEFHSERINSLMNILEEKTNGK